MSHLQSDPLLTEIGWGDPSPVPVAVLERQSRQGFSGLRKRNPKLYRRWVKALRLCFDWKDWGLRPEGTTIAVHTNNKFSLNFFLDRTITKQQKAAARKNKNRLAHALPIIPIRELSLRIIEDHCADKRTAYYTSHPYSRWALLMLDVDAHKPEVTPEHVREAGSLLLSLFPDAWMETSTHGKGLHLFLLVRYPRMSVQAFRELAMRLKKAILTEIGRMGNPAGFDITGNPPLMTDKQTYDTCGLLAKIPRLSSDEAIERFLACPCWSPEAMGEVVERLLPSPTPKPSSSSSSSSFNIVTHTASPRPTSPPTGNASPPKRMAQCGWDLAMKLGRAPTENELWDQYHALHLNTGTDDDGGRRKLCTKTADWLKTTFDPAMQKGFDPSEYLPLIRQHVTPDVREAANGRNRSHYTDEELAVVLHLIERESLRRHPQPTLQYTLPNNAIIAMFQTLQRPLQGSDGAVRNKLAVMKWALVKSGLAEMVDEGWSHGYGGDEKRGKKFSIGPRHPRYAECERSRQPCPVSAHDERMLSGLTCPITELVGWPSSPNG